MNSSNDFALVAAEETRDYRIDKVKVGVWTVMLISSLAVNATVVVSIARLWRALVAA